MDIEAALVRALAPSYLADAIIGDLHERRVALARTLGETKASAACRGDVVRSLFSLVAYRAARALADDWVFALMCAAVTCALCVVTIPLWGRIGMGGEAYHVVRLALIGLILGGIPRASALSCLFLLVLIGVTDWTIDARETYGLVLQDGVILAVMLAGRTIVRSIHIYSSRTN
jgi:hypothetical protein